MIDLRMDNDIPSDSIPLLRAQLEEYAVMADNELAGIRSEKIQAQKNSGSYSDIARFLELNEFEVVATKNRALYLSKKLKSQELSLQSGELAMLSSASLLETDSDILTAKALILRDSISRTDGFLLKKQLYAESFALEDTAIGRLEKAIAIRESAIQVTARADTESMKSFNALTNKIETGVSQVDDIMKNDIPAESIPLVQKQLSAYIVLADQGQVEIRDEINRAQKDKGSDSDIVMFLLLKEFEIRASRNRAQ